MKRIPFWKQTTSFTCDPACLLMAMNAFTDMKPSRKKEFEIWRESYGIGIPGCLPQGLAYSALKRGFRATVVCPRQELTRIGKIATKENARVSKVTARELLQRARKQGMRLIAHTPTVKDLATALKKGEVPLVMIHMRRLHDIESPHWITVTGVDSKHVRFHDPYRKRGNTRVTRALFAKLMTDLGTLLEFPARAVLIGK